MRFTPLETYAGMRPAQNFFNPSDDTGLTLGLGAPITSVPNGLIVKAFDPYWGGAEFMYCRANGTIRNLGLCVVTPTFNSGENRWRYEATEAPATANLGRALGVAMRDMVAGQYGWFCVGGTIPVNCNASVAADTTFGIAAAGQGGANVAGRQVLNARIVAAGSTTVVKTGQLSGGSPQIRVNNIDGWFVGAFLSGTGVPAATTVTAIDSGGMMVTMSNAATAGGQTAVTATYNNATIHYNVVHLNRPFAQGAIT